MQARGVHVGLWSQHPVNYRYQGGAEPIEAYLSREPAPVLHISSQSRSALARRMGGSVDPILKQLGVEPHEVVLVGNDREDMLAGVNNKRLLVRPEWYPGG